MTNNFREFDKNSSDESDDSDDNSYSEEAPPDVENDAEDMSEDGAEETQNPVEENQYDDDDDDEVVKAIIAEKNKPRDHPPAIICEDFIVDICLHPSRNLIALANIVGDILLYEYTNDETKLINTFELHLKACRDVEFDDEGITMFSTAKDKVIMATDVETGKLKNCFENAHEEPVYRLLALSNNKIVTDLSKAFDSVNQQLLVDKLGIYGIRGQSEKLLNSFLTDRQQVVEIKVNGQSIKSKPQKLNIGVPQGSSLGNTMFILFLNDMAKLKLEGELIQYADDTTVIVYGKNMTELTQKIAENMKILQDWFKDNGLKLNSDKTNIIIFNAVSPKQSVFVIPTLQHSSSVKSTNLVKLLGFEIDSALTWKTHINTTCNKMSRGIYALIQLRPMASQCYLKEVYYAYIHSVMSYGIILWGNSTDNERILKMQKRAIRILVNAKYRDSCRDLFQSLGILTSISVYIYEVVKYVRANLNIYQTRGDYTKLNLRNKDTLLGVKHRLHNSTKNPTVIGQQLYNKLPNCIKTCKSYDLFCVNVKNLLLSQTLYKVNDYIKNSYHDYKMCSNTD